MKYVDEFRNKNLINALAAGIRAITPKDTGVNIMEVCGTHTQNFRRFGLDRLLPENIRLIAGPGCPVCVSSQGYIDASLRLSQDKDVLITTFGDMLRVPGSNSTLEKQRASRGNVRMVYSALDSLKIARANPDKKVIFLAVGFETTAPTIALSIIAAKRENLKNLFFFSSLKTIPAAMDYLGRDRRLNLDGFLCPGHVSAIIGMRPYESIARKYGLACCVAGFEAVDILEGIYILIRQIVKKSPRVANQYIRVVSCQGNSKARAIISEVFKASDASWRGLGRIPGSGLRIKAKFSRFDAEKEFSLTGEPANPRAGRLRNCRCGDILKGLISPPDCPLFCRTCQPDNPVGPCMVSSEGACNAYYKYRK